MLKQFRSKVSLILLFSLFLLSSFELSSQSVTASIVNGGVISTTRPVKGKKNKFRSTVTMYAKVKNAKTGKETSVDVRESATASTPEASLKKANRKAKKKFFRKLLEALGIKKKKGSGDNVMLDENGNGDYKGGGEYDFGGLIITLGTGGDSHTIPKRGEEGTETYIYNTVEEFNQRANAEIDNFLDGLSTEK